MVKALDLKSIGVYLPAQVRILSAATFLFIGHGHSIY